MSDVSLQQIEAAKDAVSHPSHYTSGGIECKDAMAAMMGTGYCLQPCANDGKAVNLAPIALYWWGCAFKYLWRWVRKNGVQDLKKCKQCIDFLIEEIEPKTTTETKGFARDLYEWIDGVLNKNWCIELPADLDRYKKRLEALGVAL